MQTVLTWFGELSDKLIALGYPAMFLGLVLEGMGIPFPGEAALTFFGFAAAEHRFTLWLVVLLCSAGYLTGACTAYALSRGFGQSFTDGLLHIRLVSPAGMARTAHLLDKYGAFLLIPGRFLPGIRSLSAYVAGLGNMAFVTFLMYTICGSILWCTTWILLGFWLGDNIQTFMQDAQTFLLHAGIVTICVAPPLFWIHRRYRSRNA